MLKIWRHPCRYNEQCLPLTHLKNVLAKNTYSSTFWYIKYLRIFKLRPQPTVPLGSRKIGNKNRLWLKNFSMVCFTAFPLLLLHSSSHKNSSNSLLCVFFLVLCKVNNIYKHFISSEGINANIRGRHIFHNYRGQAVAFSPKDTALKFSIAREKGTRWGCGAEW